MAFSRVATYRSEAAIISSAVQTRSVRLQASAAVSRFRHCFVPSFGRLGYAQAAALIDEIDPEAAADSVSVAVVELSIRQPSSLLSHTSSFDRWSHGNAAVAAEWLGGLAENLADEGHQKQHVAFLRMLSSTSGEVQAGMSPSISRDRLWRGQPNISIKTKKLGALSSYSRRITIDTLPPYWISRSER